jgi:RNA polymerase sigma factor (sigma-70 family)
MSTTDVHAPELTDPELISRVRDGDVAAYGQLFSRHVDAATRLARLLVNGADADDLVSEAFVKVLNVLLGGGGPDVAFRAYLLTAVRRLHIDKVRSNQRLTTTGDLTPFDPGVPFTDTAVAGFEGGAAAKAFASLPERWQMVLWHLEVENQKPADIAPLLGMSPNSVSALAYRAREGLRQAFLNMHSGDLVSDACRDTNEHLGGYVRNALSRRDSSRVEGHLEHCRRCTAVYLELSEVNSSLAGILAPALLGSVAAGYLGGGAVGTGLGGAFLVLLGRGRDAVVGHATASAATAATVAVAGVVGVTALTITDRSPHDRSAAADPGVAAPATSGPSAKVRPREASQPDRKPRRRPGTAAARTTDQAPALAPDEVALQAEPAGPVTAPEVPAAATGPSAGQPGHPTAGDQEPPAGQQPEPGSASPPPSTKPPHRPPPPDKQPPPAKGHGDHGQGNGNGHDKGRGQGHHKHLGDLLDDLVGHLQSGPDGGGKPGSHRGDRTG